MPRRSGRSRTKKAPLAGVHVVDASRVLAGPYLAMLLGDLGADVIKIEKPDGGDQTRAWGPPWVGEGDARVSAYFVSANRNKRSVALDLKGREGRAAFGRLLGGADVLVENFLPSEWRRLGFRSGRFTRAHPRLVQCTVTSYGTAGPEADRPAYDVVLQAESGLMSLTGFTDGEPVRVGVAIVDVLSALYGLAAVLAALRQRDATGQGSRVEVSMADAGTSFLSYAAQSWLADGRQPARLGSAHPNLTPYQAYRAADGWLVVGVGSQELWRRFCAAIARPDLADDPRFATSEARVHRRADLDLLLGEVFATRPVAHWDAAMRAHRVPAGPPATVGEAVEKARRRGQVVDLPAGTYGILPTIAAPFLFDGERATPTSSAPALGEHTEEVLREVGMSAAELLRPSRTKRT
jgi:crotonobetainyl-CoA:carnitine CoA-transferase CaiB-like acyl-CoA transferase